MSRIIKFRAWDGKNMRYPDGPNYVVRFDGVVGQFMSARSVYETEDEWILMQFTGCFDKDGKEVYDGDILRDYEAHYRVFWCDQTCGWDLERLEDGSQMGGFGCYENDFFKGFVQDSRVINNIYQNPEFFK